ncbi:MAG TPA: hypothetical protein VFA22_00765 [Stellaceae bacterium]|nr:hypothetical protein [Stellaceae bacterium]
MSDVDTAGRPAGTLPDESDNMLVRLLGRDLQTATLRGVLFLLILCVVFATIAALVG